MTVIIHKRDGTFDKWYAITKIEERPALTNLYRDKELVKQAALYVRLEVI